MRTADLESNLVKYLHDIEVAELGKDGMYIIFGEMVYKVLRADSHGYYCREVA